MQTSISYFSYLVLLMMIFHRKWAALCIALSTNLIVLAQAAKPIPQISLRYDEQQSRSPVFRLFEASDARDETALRFAPKAQFLTLQALVLREIMTAQPEAFTLVFPFEGKEIRIDLKRAIIETPDFSVVSSATEGPIRYRPGLHYRGVLQNDAASPAAFSFFHNEAMGIFSDKALGNRVLGRLDKPQNLDGYICYSDMELNEDPALTCSMLQPDKPRMVPQPPTGNSHTDKCLRVYLECDYELCENKGSVEAAVNYLTGIFNQTAALYANEGISISVSQIFVWATPDDFDEYNSGVVLEQFRALRTNFNADLAHLVGIGGENLGGIAYVDVLCFPEYNVAYSDVSVSYANVPTYSWTVEVVAHEIGHNIGSNHTQSCTWEGGALDNCFGSEGSCPPGPTPVNGGTIMSYCHLTAYGINFANGFGPQPGNKIRERISAAPCLSASCNTGSACRAPVNIGVSKLSATSATITWAAVSGAGAYTLRYRRSGSAAWTSVSGVSSPYAIENLLPGDEVELSLRSECGGSVSEYKNGIIFKTPGPGGCDAPGGLTAVEIQTNAATIRWDPVPGAKKYLLSYKQASAAAWGNTFILNEPSYPLTSLTPGTVYDVRLQASCGAVYSNYASASFSTHSVICSAPQNILISDVKSASARISWTAAPGVKNHRFSYKLSASDKWEPETIVETNEVSVSNLMAGATYDVRVRAICGTDYSAYLTSVFTAASSGCNPPAGLKADNIQSNSAEIAWSAVAGAEAYQLSYKRSSASVWTNPITLAGTSVSFFGLGTGVSYDIRVQSVCNNGYSSYTAISFTTGSNACDAPAVLQAGNIQTHSADIAWTASKYASAYQVSYKAISASEWSDPITLTNASISLFGLNAGAAYEVRVRAVCSWGNSPYIVQSFMTSGGVCEKPQGLQAKNIQATSADVVWKAGAGAGSYRLSYKPSSSPVWSEDMILNSVSVSFYGLSAGASYDVRLQAICGALGYSDYVYTNFTTGSSACAAPANLIFTDIKANSGSVAWSASPGATEYRLSYKPAAYTGWSEDVALSNTSVSFFGLQAGTVYDVRVQAVCGASFSAYATGSFKTGGSGINDPGAASRSETEITVVPNVSDDAVLLSPNPASSMVKVRLSGPRGLGAHICLMDIYGRTLRRTEQAADEPAVFDISDLAKGIYFVRATFDDRKSVTKRLSKE